MGDHSRLTRRNRPIELRDDALRPAMRFDPFLDRKLSKARRSAPSPGNHTGDQAFITEVPHAARLTIARTGSEQKRQVAGFSRGEETLLDSGRNGLGMAASSKTGSSDSHPVFEKIRSLL